MSASATVQKQADSLVWGSALVIQNLITHSKHTLIQALRAFGELPCQDRGGSQAEKTIASEAFCLRDGTYKMKLPSSCPCRRIALIGE